MANYKFKIGQKVGYYLAGSLLFKGEIVQIDTNPKNKPYIIRAEDGTEKYAHAEYLRSI